MNRTKITSQISLIDALQLAGNTAKAEEQAMTIAAELEGSCISGEVIRMAMELPPLQQLIQVLDSRIKSPYQRSIGQNMPPETPRLRALSHLQQAVSSATVHDDPERIMQSIVHILIMSGEQEQQELAKLLIHLARQAGRQIILDILHTSPHCIIDYPSNPAAHIEQGIRACLREAIQTSKEDT